MLDLSVVIPVYNEEENLPPLWAESRGVLEGLRLAFEVVFVATADLLVVRWMKNRFLRYEVAEDLGGEPGRE